MTSAEPAMDTIVAGIRDSTRALATEDRLVGAGLKEEQELAGILEEYSWLYNRETVGAARAAYEAADEPAGRERLRRVYHALLDGYLERQTARLDDDLATMEMHATVTVDGEELAYYDLPAALSGEDDFDRRDRLHEAALAVVERSNPARLAIWRARLGTLGRDFGYADYVAYLGAKKGLDYAALRAQMAAFLDQTEATYTALMGRWVAGATGRRPGEIGAHHLSSLARLTQYDAHFPGERLLAVYARTLAGLGLDAGARGAIHLDTADRPLKNPRAACYVPDPPGEVHLVLKPTGGLDDYASFLHEAGHAQHYANTDPALGYIERALPTSFALTEVYASLFQSLTTSPAWLREVADLPDGVARAVAYYGELAQFAVARRYAAKLLYELDFFAAPPDAAGHPERYAATLSAATGFVAAPRSYLDDLDADLYTADYLRAWLTGAMLRDHLERAYGTRWFARPEAGAFLRGLWARGEGIENEEIARLVGRAPFDTTPLIERFLTLAR